MTSLVLPTVTGWWQCETNLSAFVRNSEERMKNVISKRALKKTLLEERNTLPGEYMLLPRKKVAWNII
uniref:Uncharacterized protein n=1 Tax=Caenorhabditis japonica TaxID=281687 RepID=A0A8R1IES3_CAEJA